MRFICDIGLARICADRLPWNGAMAPGHGMLALSYHRGDGAEPHVDIFFEKGTRCATISVVASRFPGRPRAHWGKPHRRRYLTYSGPVTGQRGWVDVIWRGRAYWRCVGKSFVINRDSERQSRGCDRNSRYTMRHIKPEQRL